MSDELTEASKRIVLLEKQLDGQQQLNRLRNEQIETLKAELAEAQRVNNMMGDDGAKKELELVTVKCERDEAQRDLAALDTPEGTALLMEKHGLSKSSPPRQTDKDVIFDALTQPRAKSDQGEISRCDQCGTPLGFPGSRCPLCRVRPILTGSSDEQAPSPIPDDYPIMLQSLQDNLKAVTAQRDAALRKATLPPAPLDIGDTPFSEFLNWYTDTALPNVLTVNHALASYSDSKQASAERDHE